MTARQLIKSLTFEGFYQEIMFKNKVGTYLINYTYTVAKNYNLMSGYNAGKSAAINHIKKHHPGKIKR